MYDGVMTEGLVGRTFFLNILLKMDVWKYDVYKTNRVNSLNHYDYLKISRRHYSKLSNMSWVIEVSAKYGLPVNSIFEDSFIS